MSVVYLAEDLRLKRRVALKVLASGLADDASFRDRFLRESELAASIDHPNIVPIYEAGTTEGRLFIAMRYVEGRDLGGRLQEGRLEPSGAIGILAQVASALDAAHARGLVHRDVKPSNILLDIGARPDGSDHVYLADFGLMRRVSEESAPPDDGNLMGTIEYVAPEQISGEEVDGRADVYSLGCVLYECLVGRPPFHRDSDLAVVFAHLEADPPVATAERPDLPAAVDAVISRALDKDPDGRYASCRELAQAALAVAVDEASRRLVEVASRAAAGRSDLSELESELTGKVVDLQQAREQERALAGPATPARVAAEGICPFKGLASFEPVDADYFFGRERLVAELVARLVGAGFLGIVGPSGSGKSSVLRAGLLPALAAGVLPGSEGWRRLLVRPGERPLNELRRVLVSGADDPLAEALEGLPAHGRLLLAVDQLEELFTACPSYGERAAFADALARAATDPLGRALVVVALRADFYGRFAAYPGLAELLGANQVLVSPLSASELRRVVELPAARVGLRVDPELADELVEDVEGEPGALPLLSTALLELWQKRQDNALTLAAYRESGGVHGAVARLAEGTYSRIPDERKPIARAIMLRLVGESEAHEPVRRRAPLAELDLERDRWLADVLATLADSRLVTVGEGSVEVAHEALLREWPRLSEWIEEDSEGRRLRRHITEAATEWNATDRDPSELYRGARLAAALDWSTEHAFELNELEREFVIESRDASEQEAKRARRTNRRLRVLLAGVGVLLVVAVVGGVLAAIQRGQARDAETAQLAQRLGAQALVEEDLDLSLLLARQAVAIHDSPQTRGYLLQDLLRSQPVLRVLPVENNGTPMRGIAVSRDGRTLALASYTNGVLLYDTRTYQRLGKPLRFGAEAIAYNPDGATLALGGFTGYNAVGYLRLLDAHTRKQLAEVQLARGVPNRLLFTKDGSQLVVVESVAEGTSWITIRDASTLQQIGPRIQPEGFTGRWLSQLWTDPSVALTPDGQSLVTTSEAGELTWWDLDSRAKTRVLQIDPGYRALALSPDSRTAAVGLDDGIELIDLRSGAARESRSTLASSPIWLQFAPTGDAIVSTSRDGSVTVWDADALTPEETLSGHSDSVWQPVFSPDGTTLYTTSSDGSAIAWDLSRKRRFGRPFTFTHDRGRYRWPDTHRGKFSPKGRLIAVGLNDSGIRFLDARTLDPIGAPLLETGGEVFDFTFSPDGRTLVAVAEKSPGDSRLTVWDVQSRSLRWSRARRWASGGVSISADGTTLGWGAVDGVTLLDVVTGDTLGHVGSSSGGGVGAVAFSPTENVVAFVHGGWGVNGPEEGGGDVEIWDVARQSRIRTLKVDTTPGQEGYVLGWTVAFSRDGSTLATGGADPLVHLWDVHTGTLLRELEQNVGNAVWSLVFSPGGGVLAMSGGDPYASLWSVTTGAQLGPRLGGVGSREATIDLSDDGRRLLMTHGDGKGAVWNVDATSWSARACTLANRTLTVEEWQAFLPGRAYDPACQP
jgi:WD40 repeat protein/tRNA A-37 threonylcarbamoyl transferase component Bud32